MESVPPINRFLKWPLNHSSTQNRQQRRHNVEPQLLRCRHTALDDSLNDQLQCGITRGQGWREVQHALQGGVETGMTLEVGGIWGKTGELI